MSERRHSARIRPNVDYKQFFNAESPNNKPKDRRQTVNVPSKDLEISPKKIRQRTLSYKALENLMVDADAVSPENLSNHRRSRRTITPNRKYSTIWEIPDGQSNPDSLKLKLNARKILSQTPKTPKTPSTPQSLLKSLHLGTPKGLQTPVSKFVSETYNRTPRTVRKKISKETKQRMVEIQSEDNFSSDENTDYQPTDDSSISSSDETGEDADNSQSDQESDHESIRPAQRRQPVKPQVMSSNNTLGRNGGRIKKQKDFVPDFENYFHKASTKSITSNNTLDKLTPITHESAIKLLETLSLTEEHDVSIQRLHQYSISQFPKWKALLDNGYNIITYGVGSKRSILQSFHYNFLKDEDVIVINGFYPNLTIKEILGSIIDDIYDLKSNTSNLKDSLKTLEKHFADTKDVLYILLHNIDGTAMRNDKMQSFLAQLVSMPNIKLITSCDNIHSGFLWDQLKRDNFKFVYQECPTYLPFKEETVFMDTILNEQTDNLDLNAMRSVLNALVRNTAKAFILVIKDYLENESNATYLGIAFSALYKKCRQQFLASSNPVLRTMLKELEDHKLLRIKPAIDGIERVEVLVKKIHLKEYLKELERNN